MKVYLDDERETPEGWVRTYLPGETIELLKTGEVTDVSLDHDLGYGNGNGNDVLVWIEEQVHTNNFNPPRMKVHSANPSASHKMRIGIDCIIEHVINNGR